MDADMSDYDDMDTDMDAEVDDDIYADFNIMGHNFSAH